MNFWKRLKTTLDQKIGQGVEFFMEDCLKVQGCRLAVYKEAEKRGARLITSSIEEAISSENGGLRIKLGFQDDVTCGAFLGAVSTWCDFHDLTMGARTFLDDVRLGRKVQAHEYKEDHTDSPPGARARSRSRSSEGTKTFVTEMLEPKDEQVVFQSVEVPNLFNAMDSCHLISHSECKGSPLDLDPNNRMACTTELHRALDGTKRSRYPPWVRIKVVRVDMHNPVECTGKNNRVHYRFRVDLAIEFMTEEHRKHHRFCWKNGTRDDGETPVLTSVYVEDHVTFCNGVEWKYKDTTKVWREKS